MSCPHPAVAPLVLTVLSALAASALLLRDAPAWSAEGNDGAPARARCLLDAYPEQLCEATATHLIWCDGTRMPWSDGGAAATHAERRAGPDLLDQLLQPYPAGAVQPAPAVDEDPGRIRYDALFRKMYGDSKAAVRAHTVPQPWMARDGGKSLRVTTINGVHDKLAAVARDLEALSPQLRKLAARHSGAFNWRRISGTERLSAHSFGIAVDIAVDRSDYWRWSKPGADGRYVWRNRIPLPIVEAFERHGFIWGGRWYHFDTMHFEYRPELLHPACVAGGSAAGTSSARQDGAAPAPAAPVRPPTPHAREDPHER